MACVSPLRKPPACFRFDEAMRTHLLGIQLDKFLDDRVQLRLKGESPEVLAYDPLP